MLANLIKKTFQLPDQEAGETNGTSAKTPSPPHHAPHETDSLDGVTILNNDDPNEGRLDFLLGLSTAEGSNSNSSHGSTTPLSGGKTLAQSLMDDVKVDVTLRTQLGQAPALMLLITDQKSRDGDSQVQKPRQIAVCFEVGLNGQVSVVETAGLTDRGSSGDAEMQGTDDSGSGAGEIQKQIARVLEVSQDLGILVEWVLRWLQQRTDG